MSSTESCAPQAIAPRRRRLKAYITLYGLTTITALLLLLLLLWQFSTTHLAKEYDMPPDWEKRQLMTQSATWEWIVLWVLIPTDLIHALMCLGWYHGRWSATRRERERESKRVELEGTTPREKEKEKEKEEWNRRAGTEPPQHDAAKHTPSPPQQPSAVVAPPSALQSHNPHTHFLTPPTRILLLTLHDATILTLLSLHTFLFIASTTHSTTCSAEPIAPPPALLSTTQKCDRIAWAQHSAGGSAALGAVVLGVLHLGIILFRGTEVVVRCRNMKTSAKMQKDWACAPRDVDVKPRRREGLARRTETRGEEERSVGMRVRRGKGSGRMRGEDEEERESENEQSRWCEALLECLMP